jgi:hypothetical protein
MVAPAFVHVPSTRLDTAYGSAVVPILDGSAVAQAGMEREEEDMATTRTCGVLEVAIAWILDAPLLARCDSMFL